jgi:hypothetical protein
VKRQVKRKLVIMEKRKLTLVADAQLETGRAPVDELNGALGLDGGHGSVDVLGHDVCEET